MKFNLNFKYFPRPHPLWVIQVGQEDLIASEVINESSFFMGTQDQIYIEKNTLLPNKIANPSSLQKGLALICTKRHLKKIRVIFTLPHTLFSTPLQINELFQFLISIKKNYNIVTEKILISPFDESKKLTSNCLKILMETQNQLTSLSNDNSTHPAWRLLLASILSGLFLIGTLLIVKNQDNSIITKPSIKKTDYTQHQAYNRKKTPPEYQGNKKDILTYPLSIDFFKLISILIPPTIVLKKITSMNTTTPKTHPTAIFIKGVTTNNQDLFFLIKNLNKILKTSFYLSNLKLITKPPQLPSTYEFSISLDKSTHRKDHD